MAVDKKKRNARQYAWQVEKRDRVNLTIPKGMKQELQIAANDEHITVTELINRALRSELDRPYKYGMRLRGFAPGCQPMEGLDRAEPSGSGAYHNILIYNRRLTDKECSEYELDFIGRGE